MRKDYVFSQSDSIDFELNDCGTDEFSLRFDGMLNFLFANVEIYSDSDRLVPISSSSWGYYTEDEYYTTLEAETGGSGETIYSQIKVTDATYQTGTLYCTCDNFGSYASGNAQGPDFYEITEDTAYTIDPQIKEAVLLIPSSVTTQLTITLTQGTHPCGDAGALNRVKIIDESSYASGHTVTDGTTPHLVLLQSASFNFNSSDDLTWVSAGWETCFLDLTNTDQIYSSELLRAVESDQKYEVTALYSSAYYTGDVTIIDSSVTNLGASLAGNAASRLYWAQGYERFDNENSSFLVQVRARLWHNGA